MINEMLGVYVAVISHKRPENVIKIQEALGCEVTFYVNRGERQAYIDGGALHIVECGDEISTARNKAIEDALRLALPCIQVSDDLRRITRIKLATVDGGRIKTPATFAEVVVHMLTEMKKVGAFYGGVAVSSNALNYTGTDVTYDKLIVNDLICIDGEHYFDAEVALKEDYDMSIRALLAGKVVRLDCYLCEFPHRENKGGANTYRNDQTEATATQRLMYKWKGKGFIEWHKTRPGQISLNYKAIQTAKAGQGSLF